MYLNEFYNWLKGYNFKELPVLHNKYYVYRPDYSFNQWSLQYYDSVQLEKESDELEIYGWTVEFFDSSRFGPDKTNKIYQSREVAIHAIMQMKMAWDKRYQFKIKPLYQLNNAQERSLKISKILEK